MTKYICYTIETSAGFVPVGTHENKLAWLHLPVISLDEALAITQTKCGNVHEENVCRLANLVHLLVNYFDGEPVDFKYIPVDLSYLSEFGQSVLTELRKVQYGSIVEYAELAKRIGKPDAARAVGNILGRNRTPLILPCHRVVAANRKIGGFSAGIDWKYRLLNMEGISI